MFPASDDQADLDLHGVNGGDFAGDTFDRAGVKAITPLPHQRLAGNLQEYAAI